MKNIPKNYWKDDKLGSLSSGKMIDGSEPQDGKIYHFSCVDQEQDI